MEKIKDKINGWLITLLFVMLGFIASGISYLIMGTNARLNELEKMRKEDCADIRNIANTVALDPDTHEPYKSVMEDIYFNSRGAKQ